LSVRDESEFRRILDLIRVRDHVFYGTMEELCEKRINSRGNIREFVT
jgi:hypothetical protein